MKEFEKYIASNKCPPIQNVQICAVQTTTSLGPALPTCLEIIWHLNTELLRVNMKYSPTALTPCERVSWTERRFNCPLEKWDLADTIALLALTEEMPIVAALHTNPWAAAPDRHLDLRPGVTVTTRTNVRNRSTNECKSCKSCKSCESCKSPNSTRFSIPLKIEKAKMGASQGANRKTV